MSRVDGARRPPIEPFWIHGTGWKSRLWRTGLVPAEALFKGVIALRNWMYDNGLARIVSSEIEIVSVGNLTVGGTGKTPFASWLVDELLRRDHRPVLVHGGYGLDEPELHRRWHPEVPVLVGRDRAARVHEAAAAGATVVVLDDGFQHRRLARDLDIVLVSAEAGIDRVRLLPRGPWREPLQALRRAGLVVVTRKTATAGSASDLAARLEAFAAVAVAALEPAGWWHAGKEAGPPAEQAIAVSSIAWPQSFEQNAVEAGARLRGALRFGDHHAYTSEDSKAILEAAGNESVVTTEKDLVKLESLIPPERLWVLRQRVVIERGGAVLDGKLNRIRS